MGRRNWGWSAAHFQNPFFGLSTGWQIEAWRYLRPSFLFMLRGVILKTSGRHHVDEPLSLPKTPSSRLAVSSESEHDGRVIAIASLFIRLLFDFFKPRQRLEAEILVLRHQLNILQQRAPRRLHVRWADRALFIWLYRRFPRILDAIIIVRPETVVRWHRLGFAAYWRWKSCGLSGRPRIGKEVRDLIRRMSLENPLWGAPRIHGELLKLGITVAQSTVRQDRPLPTWNSFLRDHAKEIASIDLFVVPTIAFRRLFVCLVLGHQRRQLLGFAVTEHPTAEWLARQLTEAFPWDTAPKYLIRDNDRAYGGAFKARVCAMGIRDQPTSYRSPWQNGHSERLIGSVRRECTDHLIAFNAEHLRRILVKYATYYNEMRTHVSLGKDAPRTRLIERIGEVVAQL
jgi:transposase InsO family protein